MKNIDKLVTELLAKNILLSTENKELIIEYGDDDNIPDETLKLIKDNKEDLIEYLRGKADYETIENIYPLSPLQEGMLYHYLYSPNSEVDISQMSLDFIGQLSISAFNAAWQSIFDKHTILRTSFISEGVTNPVQRVHKYVECNVELFDFTQFKEEEIQTKLNTLLENDRKTGFDFTKAPLSKFKLIKISENKHHFIWTHHHILMDGWCLPIIFKEFNEYYHAASKGKEIKIGNIDKYEDFIYYLGEQDKSKAEAFWKEYLNGFESPTPIPIGNNNEQANETDTHKLETIILNNEDTKLLNDFSKEHHLTVNTLVQSAWSLLLSRYSGENDIVFGMIVSGRPASLPGVEEKVGLFINTLPLRVKINDNHNVIEWLKEVQGQQPLLREYEYISLSNIQSSSQVSNEENLFNSLMVFENYPVGESSNTNNSLLKITNSHFFGKTNYPIGVKSSIRSELEITIVYNTLIYSTEVIKRTLGHFREVLLNIVKHAKKSVSELEILTPSEKHNLLVEWNDTATDYPIDKCIHELFEEQVEKTPDNIALLFGEEKLTYRELNEKANKLGHYLQEKGVKAGELVGLCLDRSTEMIVAILGILKAGGAYVPIDPSNPENRISYMLEDTEVNNIITTNNTLEKIQLSSFINTNSRYADPIITPKCMQIQDLTILPHPDRTLVDYSKYNEEIGIHISKHSVSIQATRGCPYKCFYCHKIWPKKHIVRPADDIFNEIKNCYEAGISRFSFIDDIFNLHKENSSKVLKKIINSGMDIQIQFPNGLRGDVLTEEFIDLLMEAGTTQINVALESASPRIQKLIGKNLNIDKFRDNLRYITQKYPEAAIGIFLMIGFPTETEEEALMTLDFLKEFKWIHFPNLNILKIYPNTDMYKIAIENGITDEQINSSLNQTFHELPNTLPFSKSFVRRFQSDFTNNYILNEERLKFVLKQHFKKFTKEEILLKYDSFIPHRIDSIEDLLDLANIKDKDDFLKQINFLPKDYRAAPDFNLKIRKHFPPKQKSPDAYKILFIDLSLYFTSEGENLALSELNQPPLGPMYLLSYLNQQFGERINGKILKSKMDFDSFTELKAVISDFKPDLIGLRALSVYKNFFHLSVSKIKHWFPQIPIIAGGPYATSDYKLMLQDKNIDLAILGEGELVLEQLINKILENNKKFPDDNELKEINSLAFIDKKTKSQKLTNIIELDEIKEVLEEQPITNVASNVQANNCIYVIYTSGSTGVPKGTEICHNNVYRVAKNTRYIDINDKDNILQLSNYAFDGSVFDIFASLLNGAKLVLVDKETVVDINKLVDTIISEEISVFFVTTALFNAIVDYNPKSISNNNIRKILFGGEKVSQKHVQKAYDLFGEKKIIHMYGPTESTVFSSYYEINKLTSTIPIGKPIDNTSIFVLGKNQELVPVGVAGELCISGDGLARGYLRNPELTKAKFINNPFSNDPNSRLYKTGDLVRYLPDGNIEFIGRIDNQVKIRGFRIELGEIEVFINKIVTINDCVVVAKEDTNGNKRLVAYIVSNDDFNVQEIKDSLSKSLPDYMVPSLFVRLEKMPLSLNGKIDRKALPEPEGNFETTHAYVAPRNEIEQKLVDIWTKVLGVEKVGVYDNFFDLGGHSILTIQLISNINKVFKSKLPVSIIFEAQSIELLSKKLSISSQIDWNPLVTIQSKGRLTPMYCMSGGAMDVNTFQPLSKYLGTNQPMYGLQYTGIDSGTKAMSSVEEIAIQNIAAIKKVNANGPYYLCGYSLGGFVAFEMAKQLLQSGDEILGIALLDSYSPMHEVFEILKDDSDTDKMYRVIKGMERFMDVKTDITWEDLINKSTRESYDMLKEKIYKKYEKELFADYDAFHTRFDSVKIHSNIKYEPVQKRYSIPITLYRAERNDDKDITLGWDRYSSFDVRVIAVPGDHQSMVKEPYVQALAESMKIEINKTQDVVLK